jgi:hypothetical protein
VKTPIYFYTQNLAPRQASGAHNRIYSNLRAYLDLGFEPEWVHLRTTSNQEVASPELGIAKYFTREAVPTVRSSRGRIEYALGLTTKSAWQFYFSTAQAFREEVIARERRTPGAIHHFELGLAGSAIPLLDNVKTVWSCADVESDYLSAQLHIDCQTENRGLQAHEKRRLRFVRRAERLITKRSSVTLCIADHETERMRTEWGCPQAEFLPMSMADEELGRKPEWLSGGRLNLLHLGSVEHFPTYRSLEFLLEKVFPLLAPEVLDRIRLNVVGNVTDAPHVKRIVAVAARFPQVHFAGFVKNIKDAYADADLHLVGSTEATGLRTRIVESFAFGVPVLSTTIGARGTAGLQTGTNILIADEARAYADLLGKLTTDRDQLEKLSRAGRSTYDAIYSRKRVSEQLGHFLNKYF